MSSPHLLRLLAPAAALVLGLAAAPAAAPAQIVNVQARLARAPASDAVEGRVEAKVDWRTGNNPVVDLGGTADLVVRRGRVLGLLLAGGGYVRSRGVTLARRSLEHARLRVDLDRRWMWEAFAQHEYDAFRRLLARGVVGSGPAVKLVDRPVLAVLAGVAYMLELERLDARVGVSDAGRRDVAHRASAYVTASQALGAGVTIAETVYVQPRLDDPGDARVLAEASVTSKLTEHIALSDALTVAYDRTPPDGIERLDTQVRVSVIVSW